MLSEAQQKRVWDGMLGEEIRADYFAELAGIYLWRQRAATWTNIVPGVQLRSHTACGPGPA